MEKAIRFEKPSDVRTAVGKEVCVTDWVTVDQQRIDTFAERPATSSGSMSMSNARRRRRTAARLRTAS